MKFFCYPLLALLLICVLSLQQSFSQVTITGSSGADGTYSSLTLAGGAFAVLNGAASQAGNTITITITTDQLTETGANI